MKRTTATNPTRAVATALVITSTVLAGAIPANAQWRFAHSNPANTGFARVDTLPANSPIVHALGSVAPGVNPVIGPEGNVYVGTADGVLHAFRANGSPYWTRKIN